MAATETTKRAAQTLQWTRKDLLGLRELSADEIRLVLGPTHSIQDRAG